MNPIEYISASLHLGLALVLLWVLLFHFWRHYRTDALREKLFKLRGDLFDYAASGEVSFDDPAYAKLRTVMNGMIRFAHKFTFSRIAMIMLFRGIFEKLGTPGPLAQWEKAVKTLPVSKQQHLRQLHDRMLSDIVWHLTIASPILMAIFLWYACRFLMSGRVKHIGEVSKELPGIEFVEAEAITAELEEKECLELTPA